MRSRSAKNATLSLILISSLALQNFVAEAATRYPLLVAGNGVQGFSGDDGAVTDASLNGPHSIAMDSKGNIFFADRYNYRIRRIDAKSGIVTTYAGAGLGVYAGDGGLATAAMINGPHSIAFDKSNNLYIADTGNGLIRRVDARTKIITTIAGVIKVDTSTVASANALSLKQPSGLCLASDGSIYINDTGNNRVIKLQAKTLKASVFAGTGVAGYSGDGGKAIEATLNAPYGIACFQRNIYIADRFNSVIRKIDTASRVISTVAGNGTPGYSGDGAIAIRAQLAEPHGIAVDLRGNIFFADTNNGRIRRVDVGTGVISTFPAPVSGSSATTSLTPNPYGVFISKAQEIYVGDRTRNQIILLGAAPKR